MMQIWTTYDLLSNAIQKIDYGFWFGAFVKLTKFMRRCLSQIYILDNHLTHLWASTFTSFNKYWPHSFFGFIKLFQLAAPVKDETKSSALSIMHIETLHTYCLRMWLSDASIVSLFAKDYLWKGNKT